MSEHGISARFKQGCEGGDAFALDVDIKLPGKGITAIFGQSGSGKTTLLRCIAGLEKLADGHLLVNGECWQSSKTFVATHQRPLGYVFQESSLFEHLSAKGNLDYAIKRASTKPSDGRYQQLLAIMGIGPVLERYPAQLSGGERQRVAITRALLIQPQLLLMDEPLASLDDARKQEILPYLERLRETLDIPWLYVSHSMDEVARLADHAVVLEQGKVVAQGSLQTVFSRMDLPQLEHDSGVILPCEVAERDSHWHLIKVTFAGGALWLRDSGEAIEQAVRVRVLAKDVSLALACHDDCSIVNRLYAKVVEMDEDKDPAMALVRLQVGEQYLLARLTRRSVEHLQVTVGKMLWAQIKSVAIVR